MRTTPSEPTAPGAQPAQPAQGSLVGVLAPLGGDALSAIRLLQEAGLPGVPLRSVGDLLDRLALDDGAQLGAVLITTEALAGVSLTALRDALSRQPMWSDLPLVLLMSAQQSMGLRQRLVPQLMQDLGGNLLVLERPLSRASLVSAVTSALRGRARQFQLRDRIDELAAQASTLRASQQATREGEARLRAITDSVDQMIWSATADGAHDYHNARWYDYTGLDEGATLGAGYLDAVHPDDRQRVHAQWQHSVLTGEAFHTEFRLQRAGGGHHWVLCRAEAVRGANGSIQRWYGSCTDIQDLVAARDVLARSAATLEAEVHLRTAERDEVWRASGDLLGVAQTDGVWLSVNPAWQQVLGWREEQIVGRSAAWLMHPDDLARGDADIAQLGRLAQGAATFRFEGRFRRADGQYSSLSWTAVPRDGRLYCVGRDVTQERAQALALRDTEDKLRQSQKMESLGQLVGGIAHDFNNMLQGVSGSLDLLRKRIDANRTDDLSRLVDSARRSTGRAAALVHRLLAFARRQPLQTGAVNVNELLRSMADMLRQSVGEAIALQLELDPNLPHASCDINQLESAVLNLALNARDAMPEHGVLRVQTRVVDMRATPHGDLRQGHYVAVCVHDSGSGMAPDVRERAFDPFFTTKPLGKGTGLGLSMIYGFAHQSGGHCEIDSAPGRGTTVTMFLPVVQPAETAQAAQQAGTAPHDSGQRAARRGSVLVVEDDEVVRSLVVDTLQELGLHVTQAIDGTTAIAMLGRCKLPDLLLTDIGLPGASGLEVAQEARRLDPGIKVLFMTGYNHQKDGAQPTLHAGMAVISKPFAMEAIAAKACDLIGA